MKLITYNVNGIRAAIRKDFLPWLVSADADIVCLQEVKATPDQVDVSLFEDLGYHVYWHAAEKKGYSGVAILSRQKPQQIHYGCGLPKYDREGRLIRADFAHFSVMSVYMPSGTMGQERQQFKEEWLDDFGHYITDLRKSCPHLIISGDYNICHQEIDIHNPAGHRNSSGFLPTERAWISRFLDSGFVDTFRWFNQQPHQYTWWSNRAGARQKNLGWRIDYHLASQSIQTRLRHCAILGSASHSDHCPVLLEISDA